VANEQNLRPSEYKLSQEEAKKGGIKSGEVRRQKKTIAQLTAMMLNSDLDEKSKDKIKKKYKGIVDDDITVASAMVAGQIQSAIGGNTKAFVALTEMSNNANKNENTCKYELPARVIGESFVKINRQIVPNKTYVFEGGRGSTKSSFISLKIVELIKNNPTMHACVVRAVGNTLRDSVYAQMKWAINELGLSEEFEYTVAPLEIKYKKTGQRIFFRGCDDEIKLKSIKPEFGYIGILWKEEKDQLKGASQERSVNQSVLRGGDISYDFSSYNPPKSKSNWVNKEKEIPNENRVIHHTDYRTVDEDWLGQKFIDDAEHLKEVNPEAYEHEYLGIPNGNGGNVFEYLEIRDITNEEIERFDRIYQGQDYGWFPDPSAFVRLAYDHARDCIFLIDENYVNKWSNAQNIEWIKQHGYDDYMITCDSAEPKSINDYKDAGLPARGAIKGAGSVEYGMKWLQCRKIVIDPKRTPNAYKEFSEYEYERDKDGNVISGYPDENNHLIDATRYALEQFYNKRGTSA
jgi:phage terminase large subunit